MAGRLPWRRTVLASVVAVLVAVVVVHARGTSRPELRVMPLGDSITFGSGSPGGYRTALWEHLVRTDGDRINFVGSLSDGLRGDGDHEGHIGWRIDQMRAHIDGFLAKAKPDVVLLDLGTNDVIQRDDLPDAPKRLADLVSRICSDRPRVQVVVASIVPRPSQEPAVQAYNAAIPGVVGDASRDGCAVTFLDINRSMTEADISADRIHPTAGGYLKMANAWYPVVSKAYQAFGQRTST